MRTGRNPAPFVAVKPLFLAYCAGTLVQLSAPSAAAQDRPTTPPPRPSASSEGATESASPSATTADEQTAPAAESAPTSPDTTAVPDTAAAPETAEPAGSPAAAAGGELEATDMGGDAAPASSAPSGTRMDPNLGFGSYPNPASDEADLRQQGKDRPKDIEPDRVFAESWWAHTRPTVEFHGNFRVRSSLYHNFSFNRIDSPESALWPRPLDDYYTDLDQNEHGAQVCTPDENGSGSSDDPESATVGCKSPTQGGADIRFRIEPAIVISDNLRVRSQIDLLSNLVMGSTAQGNMNFPAANGYQVGQRSGYVPIGGLASSQDSPMSGVNSLQDAIAVRRVWAEYDTPVGQLKFGRMPDHWGLGMLYNAGDDIDGDYQSTVDRIAFTTGLPSWSTYLGGSWDFQNEGATSQGFSEPGEPAYDLSQRDDVSRINLQLYRRMDPQLERNALAKGKVVVNGGVYVSYRWQRIANDIPGTCDIGAAALDCTAGEAAQGMTRRGMKLWTPDVYFEIKYKKFSASVEGATQQGSFERLQNPNEDLEVFNWKMSQWGVAGEIKQRLVEDRLLLGFYSGYSTGDGDVDSLVPPPGIQEQYGNRNIQTFRFHPGYRIDLIVNRQILGRVQGSYYFKPMAQYDFIRKSNGLKVGGRAEAIWTRASNFMQTPGHRRDISIELDASVYYQSKDGSLNAREDLTGGLFAMMQYGVAFPLGGLNYLQNDEEEAGGDLKLKPAQLVRMFLGVAF